ncbi:AbrB/MazE/SpoVT family DNA-binding domain-containing protein [Nocardioides bizhenqiangii]|uniref:AbrB/MazE/SpoVT family DNA-binding domain-containing protein n=1 Tax=Nocardioides bizhenqiangii TaxID=3095076 RepID=A0ABZ0ZRV9_9ACTN|nr:AbrB/MazE/SpoVT family DNA-binding domain-containing protein [Nocardioides sp. HM61]WQQ26519.1 AbrB/MazE/SpoVT family DNA-binding domain-containing protein [Nocardioides sp. HM61]
MPSSTMTSKGQITIPKEVRDDLGLEAGSTVLFVKVGEGSYRMVARTGRIQDLAGILQRSDQRPLTIEEINEGIADAAAESGRRGLDADAESR